MMDTSDVVINAEKENAPQQPLMNVGMTLREARERLGMSVNDIADRVKFAPRQVEALESNDFAHLPQATFLRGFVRSYARVLQLDETVLIAALPSEPSKQPVARAQAVDVAFPSIHSLRRVNVLWLAGALGVALVFAMFVLFYVGEQAAGPTGVVVESVPLPVLDVTSSAVVASAVAAVPQEGIAKAPANAQINEPVKAKQAVAATEPQIAAASAPAAAVKPPVPLELLRRRPLHFVFSENTWAEVIDVNGAVLLSKTNLGGSEQWIGGPRRAPYDITIAHPANVKLYYKGKEIDLSPYAGMETARLKVE
jgi:cytoskeleton protein RodZ